MWPLSREGGVGSSLSGDEQLGEGGECVRSILAVGAWKSDSPFLLVSLPPPAPSSPFPARVSLYQLTSLGEHPLGEEKLKEGGGEAGRQTEGRGVWSRQ